MRRLLELVSRIIGNEKLIEKYLDITKDRAQRLFFISLASLLSATIAVTIYAFTENYLYASFAGPLSLPILYPSALLVNYWVQRRRIEKVISKERVNQRRVIEIQYQEDLKRLLELRLSPTEEEKQKIKLFNEYRRKIAVIDKDINKGLSDGNKDFN